MKLDVDSALAEYGFTREVYEQCLSDIRDKMNGLNDLDWGDIVSKYKLEMVSDTLRKANATVFGGKFIYEYLTAQSEDNDDYVVQMDNLRREKQKLNDERAALRKISRDNARIEHELEYLEELIKNNAYTPVLATVPHEVSGNDLIVVLSDMHFGLEIKNGFGVFNSEIVEERLNKYLSEILNIGRLHKSENVYVLLLGDIISGNIHSTVQLQNRENVVEQIQGASELISAFVYELAKHFTCVKINSIGGNHSRLGLKENVMRSERLDDLILWYIKAKCQNITNVFYLDCENIDSTLGKISVRGKDYWFAHGDFDRFSEAGISKLVMMIGYKPVALIVGHLHHCSFDDIANVKIIRSGSFCDPIDDYSISKRLVGQASQMVMIVDDTGVRALYPIIL